MTGSANLVRSSTTNRLLALQHPTAFVTTIANMAVVTVGAGRGEQYQHAFGPKMFLRLALQLLTDSEALVGLVNREIREITTEVKVCHAACNPYQLIACPGRDQKVAVIQHTLSARLIIHGTTLTQRRMF